MRFRHWLLGALLTTGCASVASAQHDITAMWGSGPGDVWAITEQPAVLHFDGSSWSLTPLTGMGTPAAIWGSGPRDVFVVGERGMAIRWDGTRWIRLNTGVNRNLVAVSGRSATEVYVVAQAESGTDRPLLLKWDGRQFTSTELQLPFFVHALAVTGGGIWVAGSLYHDPTPTERRFYGVVAVESRGAWRILGFDGRQVNDPALAGAAWRKVCATATSTVVAGQREDGTTVVLTQGRSGAWTPVAPPTLPADARADQPTWLLPADCSYLFLFEQGFARMAARQWQIIAPELRQAGANMTPMQELEALGRQMQADMQAGRMPTQAQIMRLQQLQMAAQGEISAQMAGAGVAQRYAFGDSPTGWGLTGGDFWVGTRGGRIMHVTGDSSRVAFDATCLHAMAASLPQCAGIQAVTTAPPR